MIPIKQTVEHYSSKYLDGSLMYPGAWLCTYALMWGAVWVLVDRQPCEVPHAR